MHIEDDEELVIFINDLHSEISKKYPSITKKQIRHLIYVLLKINGIKDKVNYVINEDDINQKNLFRLR